MNPQIQDFLKKKLEEEKRLAGMQETFTRADAEANRQNRLIEAMSKGAASLGTIGGKTAQSSLNLGQSGSQPYLEAQRGRVAQVGDEAELAMMSQKSADDDPNSDASIAARAMIASYVPQVKNTPGFERSSARQLRDMTPIFKQILDKQQTQKETWTSTGKANEQGNLIMASNLGNVKSSSQKLAPASAQRTLPVTQMQALDKTEMAYVAADDIERALAEIPSRTQRLKDKLTLGDTPMSAAVRNWGEALGRLQSGGAISKDEEARFAAMAPTAFDSPEMARAKIKNMKEEMIARLSTLGSSPEIALSKRGRAPNPVPNPMFPQQSGEAFAAPTSPGGLSAEEQAELDELERKYGGKK